MQGKRIAFGGIMILFAFFMINNILQPSISSAISDTQKKYYAIDSSKGYGGTQLEIIEEKGLIATFLKDPFVYWVLFSFSLVSGVVGLFLFSTGIIYSIQDRKLDYVKREKNFEITLRGEEKSLKFLIFFDELSPDEVEVLTFFRVQKIMPEKDALSKFPKEILFSLVEKGFLRIC